MHYLQWRLALKSAKSRLYFLESCLKSTIAIPKEENGELKFQKRLFYLQFIFTEKHSLLESCEAMDFRKKTNGAIIITIYNWYEFLLAEELNAIGSRK
jgi:hypothetical protein